MTTIKRVWDTLNDKERTMACNAIMAHFAMERDETIGLIAAGEVLDVVLQACFAPIFNKGLDAALQTVVNKNLDLQAELELLRR